MKFNRRRRKGFTVLELLAVGCGFFVAFLCVVAAIVLILWACGVFK